MGSFKASVGLVSVLNWPLGDGTDLGARDFYLDAFDGRAEAIADEISRRQGGPLTRLRGGGAVDGNSLTRRVHNRAKERLMRVRRRVL